MLRSLMLWQVVYWPAMLSHTQTRPSASTVMRYARRVSLEKALVIMVMVVMVMVVMVVSPSGLSLPGAVSGGTVLPSMFSLYRRLITLSTLFSTFFTVFSTFFISA